MESKNIYRMSYEWIKLYKRDNLTRDKLAIQYSNFDINTAYDLRKTIDMILVKYSSEIETKLNMKKKTRKINANVSIPALDKETIDELNVRLNQIMKLQKANQTDRVLIEYNKLDDRMLVDDLRKSIDLTLTVRKRETWYLISSGTQV